MDKRTVKNKLGHQSATIVLPHWLIVFYVGAAAVLLPWTIMLAKSLPTRAISHNWDITWGGFDVFILLLLLSSAYFIAKKSLWVTLTASALCTSLFIDAWFDVLTARPGINQFQSMILAIFVEIPVAVLSGFVAIRAAQEAIKIAHNRHHQEHQTEEKSELEIPESE